MMKQWGLAGLLLLLAPPALAPGWTKLPTPTNEVRIGVLGLFHTKQVMVGSVLGRPFECRAGNQRFTMENTLVLSSAGMGLNIGKLGLPIGSVHCDDGQGGYSEFVVSIPGRITRRYVGTLEIKSQRTEILIAVGMDLETAVASVVAAESPAGALPEALKAQAVAARSYLVAGKGRHAGFDFCDTTHCQFLREPPPAQSSAVRAAAATAGLVLAYQNKAFAALYSSSCGGRTHALQELGVTVADYPYFAVPCSYCRRHPEKWVSRLKDGDVSELEPTELSRLRLARKLGWKAVPSNSYSARRENGAVVLEGVGVGHGIGLCQRGSADMALNRASFHEILEHYYPNTTVKQLP